MTRRNSLLFTLIGTAATLLAGCQSSTHINTVWKAPQPPAAPLTHTMAVVANASPAERRAGEDEFVASIKSGRAVASYTLLSDDDIKDREKIIAVVEREQFDGVAVIRLISTDRKTTYIPPTYGSSQDPFLSGGSAGFAPSGYTYQGGYTNIDTVINVECSVYGAKEKKLIWAGAGQVTNPADIRDLVEQVCRGSVEELKRQGFIK
ncbi:MAG: hypothetical protein IT436_16270 [Phycisphaerales bacterium]|nr:hypothetical protein [Phycisphaerales bacterium]